MQARTSTCDSSSWPGEDTELVPASRGVEGQSLESQPRCSQVADKIWQPESILWATQPEPDVQPKKPESTAATSQPDSPVELEGWVRRWEDPNGIPSADISWLKEDTERGLFTPVQTYKNISGQVKRRRVIKSDRMWFYPPEPPGYVRGDVPTAQLFFRSRVFVWRPVGVWRFSLKCPRGDECVGRGQNMHLYKSGYHPRVRHICDVSSWYTMLTEVLCCGPCTKAARSGEGGTVGRWLAWDPAILRQLSEAHQAMFPAILTSKRGVDRKVVRLLRDGTKGNTMVKVWRQVQENHVEKYLQRKDLYTTLLMTVVEPGGITALGHTLQAPPPLRELPSVQLLRKAFLIAEAGNMRDYRSLKARCQQLFGETVQENFSVPADVPSTELLGLEQRDQSIANDGPSLKVEVVQPGQPDPYEADKAYQSKVESADNVLDASLPHIKLTSDQASTIYPPACEFVCSSNVLKERSDTMTCSRPQPPPELLPQLVRKIPNTSTITRHVPVSATVIAGQLTSQSMTVIPATPTASMLHSTGSPLVWCRSTQYKHKLKNQPSGVGAKKSRVHNLPICTICGQPTQGHKKYKRKSFCPVKMMSPSKGLNNRVYGSYQHFTSVVDSLEK